MSDPQTTAPQAPAAPAAAPEPIDHHSLEASAMRFDQLLGTAPKGQAPRAPDGKFAKAAEPEPPQGQPNAHVEGETDAAPAPDDGGGEPVEDEFEIDGETEGEKIKLTASELRRLALEARKPKPPPSEAPEVVELRKQLETETQQARQQREAYQRQLAETIAITQASVMNEFSDIRTMADVDKMVMEDPARALRYQHQIQKLNMHRHEQQRLEAQAEAQRSADLQKYVEAEMAKLAKADPVFADPVKGEAEKRAIRDSLKAAGFRDDELAQLTDHRTVLVARKAMLYDKLMASKPSDKRVAVVQRTVRPGAPKAADPRADVRASAMQTLRKSGSVDDAAKVFRALGIR